MADNRTIIRQRATPPMRPEPGTPSAARGDIVPMLAKLYQSVIDEPVPDAILSVLDQLDAKTS